LPTLLIAGVSTRAAAESAAKAGFEVTAIDAFADLDQHPSVRSLSLPRDFGTPFSAHAAARAARDIESDAVAYLSPFDNHPRAVHSLAARRVLWGNPPDVLRRVRDPFLLAGSLRRQGFTAPTTRVDVSTDAHEWLVKPFKSGGGQGIRRWRPGTRVPLGHYAQERIDGRPASVVFVAARGRAVPLGLSHQLVGEAAFGGGGYRYCGSVLAPDGDEELDAVADAACALAQAVAERFGLVGLNGIDFIVRDGLPYPVEVNPRWCASMELVERLYGLSMFGLHQAACAEGALPAFDLGPARRVGVAIGKAIVFARHTIVMGDDTRHWTEDGTIRDVPRPGERIAAGQPVCTVVATAGDAARCRAALVRRAADLYAVIERDSRVPAN
jgi:predicted ATP-grasp superfamily ATP-dependent carboligase